VLIWSPSSHARRRGGIGASDPYVLRTEALPRLRNFPAGRELFRIESVARRVYPATGSRAVHERGIWVVVRLLCIVVLAIIAVAVLYTSWIWVSNFSRIGV
jgi:hypothetical protein